MRLSDREPQKLTKTVHKTVLAGGMVTCGMVICGMVTCGGALCVYFSKFRHILSQVVILLVFSHFPSSLSKFEHCLP